MFLKSINSLIPSEPFSLYYATIDHAIKFYKTAGRGAWLSKANITNAFKIMPLHRPSGTFLALGGVTRRFSLLGSLLVAKVAHTFSTLYLESCVGFYPITVNCLSCSTCCPHSQLNYSILALKETFVKLRVHLSEEKTLDPLRKLDFLGISLDSTKMQASLPLDKLKHIREFIQAFLLAPSVTKQDLSLSGHLNFAMRIIPQGRSFISRLLEIQ